MKKAILILASLFWILPSYGFGGIGSCNSEKDLCIKITTDTTFKPQNTMKSRLNYLVDGKSTTYEEVDLLQPSETYYIAHAIDFLNAAKIRELNFSITALNGKTLEKCRVATPAGKPITAGTLTLELHFDKTSDKYSCIAK